MAVYTWNGYTEKGKDTKGMVDALSLREAKLKLRSQGIFVRSISEEIAADTARLWDISLKELFGKIGSEDITVMTRQLSTLIAAAIPLVDALNALYEQTDSTALKKTIAQVRDSVNEGSSFADALSQHKRTFPDLYVNMVRSGEVSGALDIVLLRLAEFMEGQHRLRSKIVAAMIYPILLFCVCAVVLIYLLTSIVPKVITIFESMNQVLPLPTRILIALSDFFIAAWWVVLLACIGIIYAVVRWKKTERGSMKFDRIKMKIPLYGSVYKKISVARFARTLGTLLASGVPILESMSIVASVVQNKVMESAVEDSIAEVMDGSSIAAPLKKSGEFPPILIHMITVGEKSGKLEDMLLRVADAYEEEVETSVAGLTSVLEPFMILIMGVSVAFVVISILFPMLQISQIIR